jgi:raffinose/stachyose/melibiose transport system permease protein
MTATSTITIDEARPGPPRASLAGRRFDWGQPFVYLIALIVAAIAVGPVVYVFIGGFRTTADLNADPAGLPDPWTLQN